MYGFFHLLCSQRLHLCDSIIIIIIKEEQSGIFSSHHSSSVSNYPSETFYKFKTSLLHKKF